MSCKEGKGILKIGLIGLLSVFLAMPLKREKNEYALFVAMTAGLIIFFYALAQMKVIMDFFQQILMRLPIETGFLVPLIKMLGVAFIADYISSICREAGHVSIANQMELFAKLSILVLGIPQLQYFLEVLDEFLA